MSTLSILEEIEAERKRQDAKWGVQNRRNGTSPLMGEQRDDARRTCDAAEKNHPHGASWQMILEEEFLEASSEDAEAALRKELIQTAAVCVAWIENIDRGGQPK